MDSVPHFLKLSNQTSLDSILPNKTLSSYGSMSVLSLQDDGTKSYIQKDNAVSLFPMYGSTPHSLHMAFKASTTYNIPASYMSDGNVFTDSDGVTTSSDDESTLDDSYSSECSSASDTSDEQTGINSVRQKKFNRKCSKEQRKMLMHQMHQTRQRKECIGTENF